MAAWHNWGIVLLYKRKPTEELAQFCQALHLECKLVGYNHACIPLLLNNLAICHGMLKDWNVSTVLLQESLQLLRDCQHADLKSLRYMATTLTNLGIVSSKRKDYNQAASYFEEGLMVMESIVGEDDAFLHSGRKWSCGWHTHPNTGFWICGWHFFAIGVASSGCRRHESVITREQTLETRVQKAVMSSFRSSMTGMTQIKASIPIDVDRDTIVDAELHLAAIHVRV